MPKRCKPCPPCPNKKKHRRRGGYTRPPCIRNPPDVVGDYCDARYSEPCDQIEPVPDLEYDPNFDVYCGLDGCHPSYGYGAPWAHDYAVPYPSHAAEAYFWYRLATLSPLYTGVYGGHHGVHHGCPHCHHELHACPHCNVHVHNHLGVKE